MIVLIEDAVFASSRVGLSLLHVFRLAFDGWHRVQIDPPHLAFRLWLERQDKVVRDEVELAIESGLERDVLETPVDLSLRIGDVERAEWGTNPPRLPLDAAIRLLARPLRLVVENRHNDGAFLRTVIPSPWRRQFDEALDRAWIEIEHGGGSDMKTRLGTADREEALRLWALLESDAREPGKPSQASEALREICHQKGIPYHQLARRTIESYLPVKALQAWAHSSPGNLRMTRRRTADVFASMGSKQRHHYNMKQGFQGEGQRPIPALYDDCKGHPDLQKGFGADIASLFHQESFPIHEEWLAQDGQRPETLSMLQSILRRM